MSEQENTPKHYLSKKYIDEVGSEGYINRRKYPDPTNKEKSHWGTLLHFFLKSYLTLSNKEETNNLQETFCNILKYAPDLEIENLDGEKPFDIFFQNQKSDQESIFTLKSEINKRMIEIESKKAEVWELKKKKILQKIKN
ncbi:hypothetical protein M0812_03711 [Anaeramoeba flamelloides]|uniref:Uncharacterized protein n=1 Tax=Anaeramoeba flamelloides TaxID=1746091 RepID=A0AAV8AGV6_9EUKA|nr:hypothetical protein M0812_03711 [Anaeramoeba flamelloides]